MAAFRVTKMSTMQKIISKQQGCAPESLEYQRRRNHDTILVETRLLSTRQPGDEAMHVKAK